MHKPDIAHDENTVMEMGPVALAVADLPRSLSFYQNVLGCALLALDDGCAVVGSERPLLLLIEQRDAQSRPTHTTGLYHVAFLLPGRADLARALRHLITADCRPGRMEDHGISEALYLWDPDGNGIELYRDRPRSAWPWRNQKLEASADPSTPLSEEGLLAELAGSADTWQGLPAFTRIGHIHLQVADLAQSAAFYQGVLGFDESITGIDGASFFSVGGYHHHIGCNVWDSAGATAPPVGATGLRFFTLLLREREQVVKILARYHAVGQAAEEYGCNYLLSDPAGNGVLLTTEPLQQSEEVMALAGTARG